MPRIDAEHTDQFYINVNNIIRELLKNDLLLQPRATGEAGRVIMELLGCQERQAKTYLKEARKEIRRLSAENKKKSFKKAMQDRQFIILQAKKDNDLRIALDAMKDRDKISGLYVDEVKQTGEMTMKNVDMSKFTEHGLERLKRGDTIEEVLIDPKAVKAE